MTIREAFDAAIETVLDTFRQSAVALKTDNQQGIGLKRFDDFNRLFLSRREDEADYIFLDDPTFVSETAPGGVFGFPNVGVTYEIADTLSNTVNIHKLRGTPYGMTADIKRLCNTLDVTVTEIANAGWELGVDSPGYVTGTNNYAPAQAYTMLLFTSSSFMVIELVNNSGRSDAEVQAIIIHDFLPIDRTPSFVFN